MKENYGATESRVYMKQHVLGLSRRNKKRIAERALKLVELKDAHGQLPKREERSLRHVMREVAYLAERKITRQSLEHTEWLIDAIDKQDEKLTASQSARAALIEELRKPMKEANNAETNNAEV